MIGISLPLTGQTYLWMTLKILVLIFKHTTYHSFSTKELVRFYNIIYLQGILCFKSVTCSNFCPEINNYCIVVILV